MRLPSCLVTEGVKAIADLRERLSGKAILGYWTVEDVQIFRPDLTSAQCYEVLEAAQENFDASLGINWTVLVGFAQALYPLAERRTRDDRREKPSSSSLG